MLEPARIRLRVALFRILVAASILQCTATMLGFGGGLWWGFDLMSHFRVQYVVGLLLCAGLLALVGKKRWALVATIFVLPNAALILPLYLSDGTARLVADGRPGSTARLMLANVNTQSGDPRRVIEAIREHEPDMVVLQEVSALWMRALEEIEAEYPHRVSEPRDDNFGIALFSKIPFESAKVVAIGAAGVPSIIATFEMDGVAIHLLATHPLPPIEREYSLLRNEQLALIPEHIESLQGQVVVVGDLNVSPWSWHFRELLRRTGLRDSAAGFGVQPTWPARLPMLWIPLDHCLHSEGVEVVDRQVGGDIRSDHFPLIVDLRVVADPSVPDVSSS